MSSSILYVHDQEAKPRNILIIISLVIVFVAVFWRLFIKDDVYSHSSSPNTTTKTTTTRTTTHRKIVLQPPKVEEIQPILRSIENTEFITEAEEINWLIVFVVLCCLLLIGVCAFLIYKIYTSYYSIPPITIDSGAEINGAIIDPVTNSYKNDPNYVAVPLTPGVGSFTPAPITSSAQISQNSQTLNQVASQITQQNAPQSDPIYTNINNNNYSPFIPIQEGSIQTVPVTYASAPQPPPTPPQSDQQNITNAPRSSYTSTATDYTDNTDIPALDYRYRSSKYDDYDDKYKPRMNITDNYNYCGIDNQYDEIGCSNTRHGNNCQCDFCS